MEITVTILTKNSAKSLHRTLETLQSFAEVLVYDTGSEDETQKIANTFHNVRWIDGYFDGFGPTHNRASSEAKFDWILSIDSDEWLSPDLLTEINRIRLDPHCVYELRRQNFFQGRWIWSCGWYPDWQKKLYHRGHTQFSSAMVHESINSEGMKRIRLQSYLRHEPYRSIEDFMAKMQHYSSLFAKQSQKKSSPLIAVGHAIFTFFRSYMLKRGFMQGYEGWFISCYNAHCAFYKYLKLYEREQRDAGHFQ